MSGASTKIALISSTLGGAGLLSYFLIEPTGVGLAVGAAGLAIGAASAGIGSLARKAEKHETGAKSQDAGEETWQRLKRALSKMQYDESTGKDAERALEQLESGRSRHRNFRKILSERFDPNEITFGRYANTAEQVYLSVLANLDDLQLALASLQAMGPAKSEEASGHRQRVAERLAQNDRALAELDRVSAALAAIRTSRGIPAGDFDATMRDLEELAKRASQYSSGR